MTDYLSRHWIAVVEIRTGTLRHVSRHEAEAAFALVPGTCYGKGATAERAVEVARANARWFLEVGYR